jgi:hypothetical protein
MKKQKSKIYSEEYFRKQGAKGGKLSAKILSPEERRESARKAAKARWAKVS